MKVKMLQRNPDTYLRQTTRDIHKVPRNYDPDLHPFEVPREYVKALNAVKLERVFAKPFIGNLDGHKDGVSCLVKHPKRLSMLLSGSYDGEVRLWDLARRNCIRNIQVHEGYVRGAAFLPDGEHFLTIGDDKSIKLWETDPADEEQIVPTDTALSKTIITGISHHQVDPLFATCGELIQIWEETRNEPIRTYKWGHDSIHDVAYNPVEHHILSACGSDRSIIIYDTRDVGPVRKVIMTLRVNKVCWNPMEAFTFVCANEDYNLYTFDTRKLSEPKIVHMDHVSAVLDVDYSPTGKEFVSGSYDKSIRIFKADKLHSKEIYHTKRMQRVTSVKWSLDNKFIMSGSDEMNIRIWKARASEKLGVLKPREKANLEYNEVLKSKFAAHPQIARIQRHRQVPKHIYVQKKQLRETRHRIKQKEANRRSHSKPGVVPYVKETAKHIVKEEE